MTHPSACRHRAEDAARRRCHGARPRRHPDRPRVHGAGGPDHGRVLRHPDAAEPDRRHQHAGRTSDRDPAVGSVRARRDREGAHEERHRPRPERRRDGGAAERAAADRGAAARDGEAGPQAGRGRTGGDAPPPSRGGRPAEEGTARRDRDRGRGASGARRAAEASPTATSWPSTSAPSARKPR